MSSPTRIARRHRVPELMDDPALDAGHHRQALRGLGRINAWSWTASYLWPVLRATLGGSDRWTRVLDIASGGGDLAVALNRRATHESLPITVDGCDISPTAMQHARDTAEAAGVACEFFQLDALADDLPGGYDAVVCTLFLHHLDDDQIVTLLGRMADAAGLVVVDDLVRSRTGFAMAWLGTRVLSRSRVVHVDGPRSVRAAMTVDELRALAERAGLHDAVIERHFPQRMRLVWRRDG